VKVPVDDMGAGVTSETLLNPVIYGGLVMCLAEDLLSMIEEDIQRTEKAIKTRVAIEYLATLMEPKYREAFLKAEKNARTSEELARLLEAAKKHIGQRAAREILGF